MALTPMAYAIRLLARRDYSEKELRQRMQHKQFEQTEIDQVLAQLQQANYQSDIRFCEMLIRSRVNKGYGWLYIQQELQYKGIAEQIITEVNQELETDWYQQAYNTYQRRYADKPIADQKDKAKRMRFMQSRGFNFDQIMPLFSDETL